MRGDPSGAPARALRDRVEELEARIELRRIGHRGQHHDRFARAEDDARVGGQRG